ncbi:MAG: PQQ-binding-like beta-propeller repeat protein [Desulfobacteraceae bacterium]|nr:PQQ-binding-like beta-propeller repeat protein [Desulfobacteraceae bacterium]
MKKETVSSGDFIDDVPIRPMAAGDPIKVSNTSFEVSLTSDRYVYFSDFQIVYLWATVKNLGGTTDRFDFVLTSDAPEGWSDVKENAGFIHLGPGEQGDLKYMWSTVYARATREVEASFTYKVTSEQHGGSESFTVTVIAYPQISEGGYTDGSARVTGTITDAATGGPVSDAEVMLWLGYTIRIMPYDMLKVSDSQGAYEVGCWDIDTLNTHYGSYFTIPGYALIVQKAGYETYVHKQYVLPRNGSPTTLNISLTPLANPPDYTLAWETPLASPGVWEIAVTDAWDRFAVAMGKHPDPDDPELLPATIPFIDNQGNILWSKSLADESWAVDVTSDGKYVACATNSLGGNNFYYLWDAEGNEVWKKSIPSESIEIKFSPDNKYIATGPSEDGTRFVLYGSPGGSEQWKYNMDDKSVRAASFTDDGQYVFAGGLPHRFTIGGDLNWRNYIAYTPYVICSSEDKSRVMAADKGDCLSMFDGDGKLLWRKEQKVITYGAMSADGKVVVILTTHGYVYCYNGEGELQWCSYLRGKGTSLTAGVGGHNAVDVTPDGKYIVVGGTNYSTVLYDSDGNVLWRHMGSATYIPGLVGGGLKQSVMAVRISDDARKIVSGYGTSDPRLCYFTATTFVPDPEIKANGEDGPITVSSGAQVAVTVSLNPGNHASQNADWWLLESTPRGTLNYLVLSSGSLVQGLLPTYQGPLFTLGSTQVLNLSGLTSGTHIFYFGVDLNMNGSLDTGALYYDSVRVNVTGP